MAFGAEIKKRRGLELPQEVREREALAAACFALPAIRVLIKGEYFPAHQVWSQVSISQQAIGQLVSTDSDTEGQWKYFIPPEKLNQIFELPLDEFIKELMTLITPLYIPVQSMLNKHGTKFEHGHGFNDHRSETHIKAVCELLIKILVLAGVERESREMKLAVFGCLIHDAGNAFSRDVHSLVIESELATVLQMTAEQLFSSSYRSAIHMAVTHDEPVALAMVREVSREITENDEISSSLNPTAFLKRYAEVSTRSESALRMADKVYATDYNRVINGIQISPQALIDDPHFLVSSGFAFENLDLKNPAQLDISFSFSLLREALLKEQPLLAKSRSNAQGRRLDIPDSMKERFDPQDPDSYYFNQFLEVFWRMHFDRVLLLVIDSFRVFENVQEIRIKFRDIDEFQGQKPDKKQRRTYVFQRHNFLHALKAIKKSHTKVQVAKV